LLPQRDHSTHRRWRSQDFFLRIQSSLPLCSLARYSFFGLSPFPFPLDVDQFCLNLSVLRLHFIEALDFFSGGKISDATKTMIRFCLVLVVPFPKALTKVANSIQLLLLLYCMIFHEVTFCSHAHAKIPFVCQNAVRTVFLFRESPESSGIIPSVATKRSHQDNSVSCNVFRPHVESSHLSLQILLVIAGHVLELMRQGEKRRRLSVFPE
jgi:hypothetical protein